MASEEATPDVEQHDKKRHKTEAKNEEPIKEPIEVSSGGLKDGANDGSDEEEEYPLWEKLRDNFDILKDLAIPDTLWALSKGQAEEIIKAQELIMRILEGPPEETIY